MALMTTAASVRILWARAHAERSPSVLIFCEKTVMKAVERAPSAKRSRRRLGMRKAAMKASRRKPSKCVAKRTSRMRPRRRLLMTARATMPVVLADAGRSSAGAF